MYSLPSTSHTWLPRPRWRKSGATPCTNCVGPLLNVWVHDGITFRARARYSRDLVSGRRAIGSMALLASLRIGEGAIRAHRPGVAFVARGAPVDRLELGMAPQQLENVVHAGRLARPAEVAIDRAHELEVGGLVHGPAEGREVRLVGHVGDAERVGLLPDVGRDVLALGGEPRLPPGPLERSEREDLGIQAVGERRRLGVADVVERAA